MARKLYVCRSNCVWPGIAAGDGMCNSLKAWRYYYWRENRLNALIIWRRNDARLSRGRKQKENIIARELTR